ncbi:MAG: biopolymer transporter ExbD [Gloeomargarita sp. SKYG116]|nr:biopolymer transporter ExbD [Gloeomargarita sp. SKYG116]MCS7292521.1 biopolymer transporter ExbD [Gloeomargarita sp. SKYB120]MDW8178082.1 biopolymer transporter ExbD [Gloeomargarita sp. SKYBB_i_bin120]MDW8400418.1 biopolymer transporter ExbD [Gloeomargarita sp. SKYGB_i_bin116]
MFPLDDEGETPPEVNIVPMIDVVFSVLAFFIIASVFLTRAEGLEVQLPQAATTRVQKTQTVTLTLTQNGTLFLQGQRLAGEELTPRLRALQAQGNRLVVLLRADARVSHGQVVGVLDQLRQIPDLQVAMATRPLEARHSR